jgi:competence protein ComEA
MDASSKSEHVVERVSATSPIIAPKPAARSVGPGGGQASAPAARSGVRARFAALKQSQWFPVAARGAAIFAGMLGLAAIGALSTLAGAGVSVPVPSSAVAPSVSGVWVAPDGPATRQGSTPPSAGSSATAASSPSAPGAPEGENAAPQPATGAGITPDGKVILNRATAEELTKLPRVGAKRAQAIVELRRKLGRFQRPTDLLRVRGIGRKTLNLMLPVLVLDPPAA